MHVHGIKKLIDIPEYKVTKASLIDREIHIHLEPYKRNRAVCSYCGETHITGYHSSQWTKVEDLPISGKRAYLHIWKRRYRCPHDLSATGRWEDPYRGNTMAQEMGTGDKKIRLSM
jgi:transposase